MKGVLWFRLLLHMKIHSLSCTLPNTLTACTFAFSLSRLRKRQHSRQKGQNYSSACMKYFTLSITVREKYKVCRRRLPWRRHVQGHRYVVMIEKYRLTIVPFSLLVYKSLLVGRGLTRQFGIMSVDKR